MNWKVFLATFVFVLIVDFLWLGVVAKSFYATHLAEIGNYEDGKLKVTYWAGFVVYLLLVLGICFYVLPLTQNSDSMLVAFAYGAGFGLISYGIYDFTNYATLKSYPLVLLFADWGWGTFVCGLTTCAARFAHERWAI